MADKSINELLIRDLPQMTARQEKLLSMLVGGHSLFDLLSHMPSSVINHHEIETLNQAAEGQTIRIKVEILQHKPAFKRGMPYRVTARDSKGWPLHLTWFNALGPYLQKLVPVGESVWVTGHLELFKTQRQIIHPDIASAAPDKLPPPTHDTIYPLTAGLTQRMMRVFMSLAMQKLAPEPEWQDPEFTKKQRFLPFDTSLRKIHKPLSQKDIEPLTPQRMRLAYDELLAHQIGLSLVRLHIATPRGRSYETGGPIRKKLENSLPYSLTGAQSRTLREIDADMERPTRMLRLVQGDVGSGKTIVAALAMTNALDNNAQAALMAPTEILARQHAETLAPFFAAAGIRAVLLTGRDKGKRREIIRKQISSGMAQVVIGTHALFQDDIDFENLGLVVIDEQHRFGVHQRLQLSAKGRFSDVLVMTATPIPRTLALTVYGDMDISRIDEKPPGRKPVDTRLIPAEKLDDLIAGISRQIEQDGAQVYWVCPLVTESEVVEMTAAESRFAELQQIFGDRVGLVHGQMKPADKDAAMADFVSGKLSILVATTVIEVGVNVPNASVMVIEHAERFGLSQLHQLRGRVGRGERASHCMLMYQTPLSATAKERLRIMRETEDGFLIAEKDMELRGAGDILGTRQSGIPDFRFVNFEAHKDLFNIAHDDARLLLQKDPNLSSDRGHSVRRLLALFDKQTALNLVLSG